VARQPPQAPPGAGALHARGPCLLPHGVPHNHAVVSGRRGPRWWREVADDRVDEVHQSPGGLPAAEVVQPAWLLVGAFKKWGFFPEPFFTRFCRHPCMTEKSQGLCTQGAWPEAALG
jgi:hypothetical protein